MPLTTILTAIQAALVLYPEASAAISSLLALGKDGTDPTPAQIDAAIADTNAKLAQARMDAGE
jgi:hypothetical protein